MKTLSTGIITALTILTSCTSYIPISEAPPKNNSSYNVSYLFEHDGVKVYRFLDASRYVYFTNCGGEATSVINDSTQVQTRTIK